ncbi:hypothetical protein DSECCO2_510170 [anaerobic digester metagenome]
MIIYLQSLTQYSHIMVYTPGEIFGCPKLLFIAHLFVENIKHKVRRVYTLLAPALNDLLSRLRKIYLHWRFLSLCANSFSPKIVDKTVLDILVLQMANICHIHSTAIEAKEPYISRKFRLLTQVTDLLDFAYINCAQRLFNISSDWNFIFLFGFLPERVLLRSHQLCLFCHVDNCTQGTEIYRNSSN